MANLQIKNISEDMHQKLREAAAANRTTISEIVLNAVARDLARKSWQASFQLRSTSELSVTAAELLEEERALQGR